MSVQLRLASSKAPAHDVQEDFNLSALINSVERDIWLLEQLEEGSGRGGEVDLPLPLSSGLLALPGYRPRRPDKKLSGNDPTCPPHLPLRKCQSSTEPGSEATEANSDVTVEASRVPPTHPPDHLALEELRKIRQGVTNPGYEACPILKPPFPSPRLPHRLPSTPGSPPPALPPKAEGRRRRNSDSSMRSSGSGLTGSGLPSPPHTISPSPLTPPSPAEAAIADQLTERAARQPRRIFCPLCTAVFQHHQALQLHLLDQHPEELQLLKHGRFECFQPGTCPVCHAQFLASAVTSRHLVHHHPEWVCSLLEEDSTPVNNKNVFCRFCGQKFFRKHMKLLALHIQQTHRSHFDSAVLSSVIGAKTARKDTDSDISVASFEASLLITPAVRIADSPRPPRRLLQPDTTIKAASGKTASGDIIVARRQQKEGLGLRFSVPEEVHYYETIETPPQEKERRMSSIERKGENRVNPGDGKRERSEEELTAVMTNEVAAGKLLKAKQDKKRIKRVDKRKDRQKCPPDTVEPRDPSHERQRVTPRPAMCYRRPIARASSEWETYRGQPQPQPPANLITGLGSELSLLEEEEDFTYTEQKENTAVYPDLTREMLFRCNLCRKGFALNDRLLSHLKTDHLKVSRALKPQYGCGKCRASFFNNSFLLKHCVSHSVLYIQESTKSVGRK